ncbi:MAG: CPBP family intramembrane metalloprotease [Defluviitaleaceae bacterium]|nr:CPBP family intramembrane metalloprotease [Defluviitaleaceae bacterium]
MKSSGTFFFIFLVAYQLIFYYTLARLRPWLGGAFAQSPWFLIVLQIIALLLPLFIWLAIKKERLRDHIPNNRLGFRNVVYILVISFLMLPVMSLISALSTFLAPNAAADALGQLQPHSLWLLLLAMAVTPAVAEELVFRGYIQSQYPGWAFWKVALLNGFLFGFIHLNIQQFFYAFAMGVVMAYFVYHTRSIRAGILSHFFVNAFNIALFRFAAWLVPEMERLLYEAGDAEALTAIQATEVSEWAAVIFVGVIAVVFLPFAVILFRMFIRYNKTIEREARILDMHIVKEGDVS